MEEKDWMAKATNPNSFFNELKALDFGRARHIENAWMYSYEPPPLVRAGGERIVFVRFYISDECKSIRFNKIIDGQQRQYQNSYHYDQDDEEEVSLFYRIKDTATSKFEFAIYVDEEMDYYNFFHKEEHLDHD